LISELVKTKEMNVNVSLCFVCVVCGVHRPILKVEHRRGKIISEPAVSTTPSDGAFGMHCIDVLFSICGESLLTSARKLTMRVKVWDVYGRNSFKIGVSFCNQLCVACGRTMKNN
jgi:hypothetical protein